MKITGFLKKYSHAWVFLYGLIYMPWFLYLENHVSKDYYLIHSPLDDYIPFIEYFIVPYLLWFVFIAVIVGYFFFTNKKGFYRLCAFMFTGMTIFLIVCTVFPNGLDLRPDTLTRDNIFTDLVRLVYAADTPTNVLPSIHVFNTLSVIFAVAHDEGMKNRKRLKGFIYIFGTLINNVFKATFRNGCLCRNGNGWDHLSFCVCACTQKSAQTFTSAHLIIKYKGEPLL